MPEFEEKNNSKNEAEAYSPRNDSRPRSRRSGGFKNNSALLFTWSVTDDSGFSTRQTTKYRCKDPP